MLVQRGRRRMASRRSPSNAIGERSVRTSPSVGCASVRSTSRWRICGSSSASSRSWIGACGTSRGGEALQPLGARARREYRTQRGFQRFVVAHAVHARRRSAHPAQAPARSIAATKPSQNLTGDDRWIAISAPSAHANANDCDTRPRSVVFGHHAGHEVAVILLDREVRHCGGHRRPRRCRPRPVRVRASSAPRMPQAAYRPGHRIGGRRTDDARHIRRDEHAREIPTAPGRPCRRRDESRTGRRAPNPRDRAVHEPRIALHHLRRAEAQALDHAGPEVLHVDVGRFEQLPHQRRGRASLRGRAGCSACCG